MLLGQIFIDVVRGAVLFGREPCTNLVTVRSGGLGNV